MTTQLCDVTELKDLMGSPQLTIIDASWYVPAANVDCYKEFSEKRIPGSVFFDIDAICDRESELPHMLPSAEQFADAVTGLGINNKSNVVVYDTAGLFSAARVWWMFKAFGHDCVRVLDGGLPAWCESNGKLQTSPPQIVQPASPAFNAHLNETFLVDKDVLTKNVDTAECLVLDARSKERFSGAAPEPRAGLESGHMPHSESLPFDTLIIDGRLKQPAQLADIFAGFGLDPAQDNRPIVSSCGSGVTAAIITLALVQAGFGMHRLYDGAWAEWASVNDTMILKS